MPDKKYPVCTVDAKEVARLKGLGFLRDKTTEDCFNCRVITVNGKVDTAFLRNVSEAAETFGNGQVAFTSRMTTEIQKIPYGKVEDFLGFMSEKGIRTGGTGPKIRPVVSCKGTTCQYGLVDTFALSEAIHNRFFIGYNGVKLPHKFKIAVGGCPNNCVKPDINDVGIIGQREPYIDNEKCIGCGVCAKNCPMGTIKIENKKAVIKKEICNRCGRCLPACKFGAINEKASGYRLYIGGRWGKKVDRGTPLDKIFGSEEEILSAVEKTILFYKEQGTAGERLADTIARAGLEKAVKEILGDEILSRKEMILSDE